MVLISWRLHAGARLYCLTVVVFFVLGEIENCHDLAQLLAGGAEGGGGGDFTRCSLDIVGVGTRIARPEQEASCKSHSRHRQLRGDQLGL